MKRTIKEQVYETSVTFLVGVPVLHFQRVLDRAGIAIDTKVDGAIALTACDAKRGFIWIESDPEPTDVFMETLMHELGHFAFHCVRYLGLKASDEEAFLYFQGSYLRRAIQVFFKS